MTETAKNKEGETIENGVWKSVSGYEGRYEVSDGGQVRSLSTYRSTSGGVLSHWVQNKGYHYVTLRGPNNTKASFAVHRLVLEAFVSPCPPGKQVAHNNGDPSDNRVSNLRWATAKENIADRTLHGRTVTGEAQHSAKLDRYVVKTIKKMQECGCFSAYETARLACVHTSTVQRIWDGEIWKTV
jgi:hypothetical protein